MLKLAMALMLLAYQPGQESTGVFIGCDTEADAVAFFSSMLVKEQPKPGTCGRIEGTSLYIREVSRHHLAGVLLTIHEVALVGFKDAPPTQFVATVEKELDA